MDEPSYLETMSDITTKLSRDPKKSHIKSKNLVDNSRNCLLNYSSGYNWYKSEMINIIVE